MDMERIAQLAKMSNYVGDSGMESLDKLPLFLDTVFGIKRLLIIKADGKSRFIIKRLKDYCSGKIIEFRMIKNKTLTPDYIRGEVNIVYKEGTPYSYRSKPEYVTEKNQMIVVEGLGDNTDHEILRAFMYMASLGSYFDDIDNLPKDKLPYGSSFVFIADETFPLKKFASISSHWNDEASALDLRSFQTRVKEHMGKYKNDVLNVHEPGEHIYKNETFQYDHILPRNKEKLNIIEKFRNDFWDNYNLENENGIKLHKHMYFHHLNSSQAACINFFYPLLKEDCLNKLLRILKIDGEVKDSCFEKISTLDVYKDGNSTNFDFYIEVQTGINVYFEIKYTEYDFGKARSNEIKYTEKYNELYAPIIARNQAINDEFKTEDFFLENYQLMRNIAHIDENSYVVFLYPEGNKEIRNAALKARREIIKDGWRNHFIPFTFEELIRQLNYRIDSQELKDYYNKDFSEKYLHY